MGRKVSVGAAVALVATTVAVTFTISYQAAMNKFNKSVADINERQAMYSKLNEVDTKVRQNYLGEIDESKLKDSICAGYIAGLSDSKGQYMNPEKYKEYAAGNSEKFIGIGVETIQNEDGNMEVVTVLPNSSAEKSGIKKGDLIIEIDGKDVRKIGYSDAISKLDGTADSVAHVKLLQNVVTQPAQEGQQAVTSLQTVAMDVVRTPYEQDTVGFHVVNNTIGYVSITKFTENTSSQLSAALDALKQQNVTGIIFDVRNNVGGNMTVAGNILDTLLPAGNLISSVDKQGKTVVEKTSDAKQLDLPMSVLINDGTFGAAEVFASAIKDYKKGMLVGSTTAGKGTKDEVTALSDGSAIVISVANYTTPNSGVFTGVGISPDIAITLSGEQRALFNRKALAEADDPQMQAAITAFGVKIEKNGVAATAGAQ